ncbi:DUF4189 domain-containing protein [Polyangium jinanense]|uniref:DUF4189 domain-containing protein n=1 Tax=Polyangium jinanense TaxID=2829994 RepID=A0A9X4AWJ0_9BACT|nr:DUF4189 domain-containing protein [Polyangium jinanense]MDC3957114.1 DUF4189 domain-containing protein [Polyangium jinanense]MDC3986856.1 DUF4189 domain-containing protein [Polyangium jinanense]
MTISFVRSTSLALICIPVLLVACKGGDKYGAVAISASTGKFGGVVDRASQEQAQKDATALCGQPDCGGAVAWFKNACVSVAQGTKPMAFGSNPETTQQAAEAAAIKVCSQTDSGCKTVATFCTSR